MSLKRLWNSTIFQILVLFISIDLIYISVKPFVIAANENEELTGQLEEVQKDVDELTNSISVYQDGGVEQQKLIRDQYHLSNPEEIIFEFPE